MRPSQHAEGEYERDAPGDSIGCPEQDARALDGPSKVPLTTPNRIVMPPSVSKITLARLAAAREIATCIWGGSHITIGPRTKSA